MSNVGYATLQIIPSARGFGTALTGQTAAPMAAAGKTGGKKFGGAMLGSLKSFAAPLAAILGAQAIGGFVKSTVSEASDLNESINAVNVAYGKNAKAVLALGKNSATAFGLSKSELNAFAVRFSGFAKTVAGKKGSVAGTFKDLAGRATDFASVFNVDVDQAAQLFQSGLAGETEPLRRFGIDMSAAATQAFAYANGIAKSGEKLSNSQKVQARYGLLMKQTSKTQGDFKNTSDQLANQQRILSKRWKDAKATLGTALLPAVTAVVRAMNSGLGPALDFVKRGLAGLKGGGGGGGFLSSLAKTFGTLADFGRRLLPIFREIGGEALAALREGFSSIGQTLSEKFLPALRRILPILQPVAAFLLRIIGGALVGALKGAFQVIQGVLTAISGLFQIFASLVTGDWSGLWKGLKTFASGVWTTILGAIKVWWNVGILQVFRRAAAFLLKGIWRKLWAGLKSAASKGLSLLKGLFSKGLSLLKSLVLRAVRGYLNLWKSYLRLIVSVVRGAFNLARSIVRSVLGAIRSFVGSALSRVVSFFRSRFRAAYEGARSMLTRLLGFVRGLPGKIVSALGNLGGLLKSKGVDLLRGFISGIKSMAGSVVSAIRSTITDKLPGFVKKALGIHSPSKVFMSLGRNVAEGMAVGIESGSGRVTKAVSGLAEVPSVDSVRAGSTGAGPLIGSLTLQGSGNVRDDLEEVNFQVRRIARGGVYA